MKRFYEIIPGALAWSTLILMVMLSWRTPFWVAVFIILFDVYWLLKTIYLSFHIRVAFKQMRNNISIRWLDRLMSFSSGGGSDGWGRVRHLIILSMYKEPYEMVRESMSSLANAKYPSKKLWVVLGIEEAAGEDAKKSAEKIREEFEKDFGKFLVTIHPKGLSGEMPGKGSNEAWAVRQATDKIINKSEIDKEDIIVSSFDIDTQIPREYFAKLTYSFLNEDDRLRAIYQPIPLFTNNVYQAPAFARVVAFSATFWQMMQQARPERLTTFSSQSIPLKVLEDVGYWDTDIVSEDSRIFWQAYIRYNGNFRVVPLNFPVNMDANVADSFWGTMKNLYRQQRRWGWGVENIPYMLSGFKKNKNIKKSKKWFWSFTVFEGFHSWATNALMIFALGWLPLLIGGEAFEATLLSYSLPRITRTIIGLSMVGVVTSAILSVILLPPKPDWFKRRHYGFYMLQWLFLPITLIFFGAIPGLEAQTRLMLGGRFKLGFWVTPKFRDLKVE